MEVRLKRAILDPQGRTVETTLKRLGHGNITDLRVGKLIELTLSGEREEVEAQLTEMTSGVLSNPVMEEASFSLSIIED